ncbi:MAG: UDP-N-acetylmuramoyl-L-alanyl-D-glutamate--2,6-diaminopimelate ligase [Gammaproteobacteria bacterium]|nr:UDP-N-acetylmuramoyl-L-alanyl-D-glutamate--2,6-diaminopimelate ligase [Gammaproteobacteria bacterium]MBQ0838282.1 UDP-N-acetylmuramoyl-L-alanyl-D-glutamate--2,6-diaminopimelate ligase [Gammaproteobacteria bacterium]
MALSELLAAIDLSGESLPAAVSSLRVEGLQLDSRKLAPGDLFIAFPGQQSDGRNYLADAQAAGAVAALVESEGFSAERATSALPIIAIENLAKQVSAIAGRFYAEPSARVPLIGITGTNGKTTCTQLLAQLLALLGEPSGLIGTLGYGLLNSDEPIAKPDLIDTGLTTPDALSVQAILAEFLDAGAAAVAMEVSSHSLDQGRVAGLHFSSAVFTNLSRDHLDYHHTMGAYQQVKAQLFHTPGLKNAIVNSDDPAGRAIIAELAACGETSCYSYSSSQVEADIHARDATFGPQGISANLTTPWGQGELRSSLQGEFNLSNLLAVIGVACAEGQTLRSVLAAVEQLKPVPGRLEVVDVQAQPLVVVDYAHSADALEKALSALRVACQGRLWCVFGCGGDRDQGKRALMGSVAAALADQLVITSDNPRGEDAQAIIDDVLQGVPDSATEPQVFVDRRAAIGFAVNKAAERDVVLIAGKGHEDYQLIKDQRLPFNDVLEARLALRQRVVK